MSRHETTRVINVRECKRLNGKDSILLCARCGNEVESKPNTEYFLADEPKYMRSKVPRHNFCPWCSAPLREVD